jgi:hypothetical protein
MVFAVLLGNLIPKSVYVPLPHATLGIDAKWGNVLTIHSINSKKKVIFTG